MGYLQGYITIDITKNNGDIEEIQIDGDEFSLEEENSTGDDYSTKNVCYSSIYRARCQGIQIQLTAVTTSTQVMDGYPIVEILDIEDTYIKEAHVKYCGIDDSSLLPGTGENGF